jgi:DNA-binding transcriptional LysR family regulator
VDPDEEGYDLVLRIGEAPDRSIPFAQIEYGVFASPSYCAMHKRPHGPSDLPSHAGLYLKGQESWRLRGGEDFQPVPVFVSNRTEALKDLCRAGQGIALLPKVLVRAEIEKSELVLLLDGFEPKPEILYGLHSRHELAFSSRKMLTDFLAVRFKRLRL